MALNDVTTVVAKSGQSGMIATSARLAASKGNNELWLRVMMLAPSASTSMSVTVFGDADLTAMRRLHETRRSRTTIFLMPVPDPRATKGMRSRWHTRTIA